MRVTLGPMKFGVWIPNCRHLATPDIIRTTAVPAEQLGYDSVWVSDHVVVPNANVANFGEAIFDPSSPWPLRRATSRVKLGTTVLIVPYRNAIVTAKMVSSLDALSGGRVILGIGAGWVAAESAMLGVPFDERGAMTDEHLRAMQELWTSAAPAFGGSTRSSARSSSSRSPCSSRCPSGWAGTAGPRCGAPVAFGAAAVDPRLAVAVAVPLLAGDPARDPPDRDRADADRRPVAERRAGGDGAPAARVLRAALRGAARKLRWPRWR